MRAQKAGQTVVTVTAPDGSSVSFIVAVSAGAFTGEDQFDASQIVLQLEVTDKEAADSNSRRRQGNMVCTG